MPDNLKDRQKHRFVKNKGRKKENQAAETGWLRVGNQKIHTGGE